ncbi:unnamed protein product [Microthlaspi erraticum]|uniref:Uncharacterized protein n=1 Tax=Microthlaspi erraticum TaxID=1685480 RepID=A0A6D2JTX2_9BRAS|nr:unnamed protein product [Microthlaspi erraticum]
MGREEHGRTWRMDAAQLDTQGKKEEAILKTSSTIYSTNRSSSSTRPAKLQLDRAEKSTVKPEKCCFPLDFPLTLNLILFVFNSHSSLAFILFSAASRRSASAATLIASSISALSTTLSASAAASASAAFLRRASAASERMASPRSLSGLSDDRARRLVLSSSSMATPLPFLSRESIPITQKIRKFEDWSNGILDEPKTLKPESADEKTKSEHNLTRFEQFVIP